MKRLPPIAGKSGFVLMGLGLAAALAGLFVTLSDFPISPFIIAGAFLYLIGGFLAVASFDYVKGSRVFLAIRIMRIAFAAIVMISVVRGLTAR